VVTADSGNGIGDPLVWSPANLGKLLSPELWILDGSTPFLHRTPEMLRDLVRFGHAERGLRPGLTAAALTAVEDSTEAFLEALREAEAD
jgi:hypothetical protein